MGVVLKSFILIASVLLCLMSCPAFAADATLSGEVTLLKGPVSVTHDGKTLRLYPGASVIVGDRINTGKNARLKLRMIDGAEIALGEYSEFIVREYELRSRRRRSCAASGRRSCRY